MNSIGWDRHFNKEGYASLSKIKVKNGIMFDFALPPGWGFFIKVIEINRVIRNNAQ